VTTSFPERPRAARLSPHFLVGSLCLGLATANLARASWALVAAAGAVAVLMACLGDETLRPWLIAVALCLLGWGWGSARLAALDRSVLLAHVDTAERTLLVVTGPARRSQFDVRVPAQVRRFGGLRLREAVLLEVPLGRSPPQGAVIETIATVRLPRPPKHGFDERTWLRRRGIHVVLKAYGWKEVGRRGGIGGLADRLRRGLARRIVLGLAGERRGVVEAAVLGDEAGIPDQLRERFRASGLSHLLVVSGEHVTLVAGGTIVLAWLLGLPRWLGQLGVLASLAGYSLAVGPQPSVIRAGIAGALGSLAWLAARQADRWYFLLLGVLVLLAWNPYDLLDVGFQLSFIAVAAIFALVPRMAAMLEGYPLPRKLAALVAVSTACGLATAPVLWFQFHSIPLWSVPANTVAAPSAAPLLALAFATAVAGAVYAPAGAALAWLNGWCAAYLAGCARSFGGLPGAQVQSGRGLVAVLVVLSVAAAYAWRRWQSSLRST
jgi:competence protein ComEC